MDTSAIIQFIGIVLFSSQIPGDPGVHAIMPRIGSTQTSISSVSGIEDHKAVILYRQEDLLEKSSWKSFPAANKGWDYVELDGERVQFFTDADNTTPLVPYLLPRAGGAGICAPTPTLASAFLPSTSYKGAVGVFDFRVGFLDACESRGPRADTRLFLRTQNVLIISARKGYEPAKTITLDEDAVVFVANVPPEYLSNNPPQHHHDASQAHWAAYNVMLGGTCSARPKEVGTLPPCDLRTALTTDTYAKARANPPSKGLGVILDAQCANSQWP